MGDEHSLPMGFALHTIANIICIPCFLFHLIPIDVVFLIIYMPLNIVGFVCMFTDKRLIFKELNKE